MNISYQSSDLCMFANRWYDEHGRVLNSDGKVGVRSLRHGRN